MKKKSQVIGVIVLCAMTFMILSGLTLRLAYLQLVKGADYSQAAQRTTRRSYTVAAARGQLYDRSGIPLVSNRLSYSVVLDYLSWDKKNQNEVLLELARLLEFRGVTWYDTLPVTRTEPFAFTMETMDSGSGSKLSAYIDEQKDWPEGISPDTLIDLMCEKYQVDDSLTRVQKRAVVGLRYELYQRDFSSYNPCIIAAGLDVETVALLSERHLSLPGVTVTADYSRRYETDLAAHLLGRVGVIYKEEYPEYKAKGYPMNAIIGKEGLEKSLEDWLKPTAGIRTVKVDQTTGNIVSDQITTAPQPGADCYLTLDIGLQAVLEQALEDTILDLRAGDPEKDKGTDAGGAAAVVMDVNSGEILGMASYPTYSLATFSQDWALLSQSSLSPYLNRAISGTYAPGSTFKMLSAIAALEEGIVTPTDKIKDEGVYRFYEPNYTPACWIWNSRKRTHGDLTVSDALKYSCNYYFYEVGRLTGIETLNLYARQFGLGQKTGVELTNEKAGILAGRESREKRGGSWYGGDTIQAAIGQSDNLFTPLQLCSYISTLANGGTRYQPHLLREVRDYTGTEVLSSGNGAVLDQLQISASTLRAVYSGMLGVTTEDGTASSIFANYPIQVAGKTGSAEVGTGSANGVFVAFAPYDDPQIAICVVGEHAGSGGNVAPVAKAVMNYWFKLDP